MVPGAFSAFRLSHIVFCQSRFVCHVIDLDVGLVKKYLMAGGVVDLVVIG